jgi:DNA-binding NarL/FixJ family response regulator
MSIRILLVDDHQIVREGIKALLEQKGFEVIAEASDGSQAIRMAKELHPDVIVLDLSMPVMNGMNAARHILLDSPSSRIAVLTMHTEEQFVLDALQAGISGFVVKTEAASDLVRAVNEMIQGSTYLSPKISRAVVQAYLDKGRHVQNPLTPRELQILQLIAEGKSNKEMASLLSLSTKTIEAHRTAMMKKLNTHGIAGLVRYAIRSGLIDA